MSSAKYFRVISTLLGLVCAQLGLVACSVSVERGDEEYLAYRQMMPRSILILPPTNDSIEVDASYSYLSTVSQPFAEKGYYVFPVAVVDVLMKENGLPMPEDMHGISLQKIDEVFGADAVLYIHIKDFGQKFQIVSSATVVNADAKLVDVKSGSELWRDSVSVALDSGSGQGGLLGMVLEAAITQAISDQDKNKYNASRVANKRLVSDFLIGPLHPEFGK